jgi:hypothetical protein
MRKYLAISCGGVIASAALIAVGHLAFAASFLSLGVTAGEGVTLGATASSDTASQTGSLSAVDESGDIRVEVDPLNLDVPVPASTTVMTAALVRSSDDLRSYAVVSMKSDDNIRGMTFSGNDVEVDYREPGKFLGFIPVSITAMADANADGAVTVSHPWYDFLVAKDDTAIESSLSAGVGPMASASASGKFSYASEARIADAMKVAIKRALASSVSASAQANSSVSIK